MMHVRTTRAAMLAAGAGLCLGAAAMGQQSQAERDRQEREWRLQQQRWQQQQQFNQDQYGQMERYDRYGQPQRQPGAGTPAWQRPQQAGQDNWPGRWEQHPGQMNQQRQQDRRTGAGDQTDDWRWRQQSQQQDTWRTQQDDRWTTQDDWRRQQQQSQQGMDDWRSQQQTRQQGMDDWRSQQQSRQQGMDDWRWQQQSQQTQQSMTTTTGTIESIRTATLRGERHLIVFVDSDRGYQQIDLGPIHQVRQIADSLQEGGRITIAGSSATIGGRQVLLADRVQVDGRWIPAGYSQQFQQRTFGTTEWQQSGQQWTQQGGMSQQPQWFTGTVQSVTTTNVQNQQHLLITLNTDRGPQQVDLGPVKEIQELRSIIREGKNLLVSGVHDQQQGRQIIKAHTISFPTGHSEMSQQQGQMQQRGQFEQRHVFETTQSQSFEGTVQSVQVTNIANEQHLVISLHTDEGVKQINLGPANQVQHLRTSLREGQELSISGSQKQMDGKPMIVAQTLELDGQRLQVNQQFVQQHQQTTQQWTQQEQQWNQQQQRILGTVEDDQDTTSLSGTVQSVTTTRIDDKDMLVVSLNTPQGAQRIILGESDKVAHIRNQLREGSQVSLKAKQTQKQGQTFFKAKSVTVNGQTIEVHHDKDKDKDKEHKDYNR
jgi:hypothetical protein